MTKLLTLTGAGGCGKTRLALEVARGLVGACPDGVWLVELAPLSEGVLVAHALASVLGVNEQPDRSLTDALVDFLGAKRALLVLDNCEHLVDAVARFVDTLLDSCSHLRVLATSRESLNVEGELNWLVPSLSVPSLGQSPRVEELERYESVRLFVEQARHRNPDFSLTSENANAVARICEQLEGIPLAIELAAARVGLSVEQIAARLDDSLRLLSAGSRTASPRQRTLRGTLDWSHALLSEPERRLFGRLSVFAGGWTLEAAEVVGAERGSHCRVPGAWAQGHLRACTRQPWVGGALAGRLRTGEDLLPRKPDALQRVGRQVDRLREPGGDGVYRSSRRRSRAGGEALRGRPSAARSGRLPSHAGRGCLARAVPCRRPLPAAPTSRRNGPTIRCQFVSLALLRYRPAVLSPPPMIRAASTLTDLCTSTTHFGNLLTL
jgi:NB-ARC domain